MIYININSVSTFHIDVQYMSSVCLCVCVYRVYHDLWALLQGVIS